MAETSKIAIEIGLDTTRLVEDLRAAGDALHAAADRLDGKARLDPENPAHPEFVPGGVVPGPTTRMIYEGLE